MQEWCMPASMLLASTLESVLVAGVGVCLDTSDSVFESELRGM